MDELTRKMYKVLAVPESASISEIESKYREMVSIYQAGQSSADPHSRQEAWAGLKEVSSAYEIVKKYWYETNMPPESRDGHLRPSGGVPGTPVKKKRSAASAGIVAGLVCIAIIYYGYGFMKRPSPHANAAPGELRLFTTSR